MDKANIEEALGYLLKLLARFERPLVASFVVNSQNRVGFFVKRCNEILFKRELEGNNPIREVFSLERECENHGYLRMRQWL